MSDHALPPGVWAARLVGPVAALLLLFGAGACSGARGGTSVHAVTRDVTGCAAALPVARASVPGRAVLVEIHSLRTATALRILRSVGSAPLPGKQLSGRLCVVAYKGPYHLGQLPLALTEHGRYAVLVLRVRHPQVLALVLVDTLPSGV